MVAGGLSATVVSVVSVLPRCHVTACHVLLNDFLMRVFLFCSYLCLLFFREAMDKGNKKETRVERREIFKKVQTNLFFLFFIFIYLLLEGAPDRGKEYG